MPSEGSLDKVIVNRVFEVVAGEPGYPDQFPHIDCWQDAVISQHKWLKPHLKEACRIMVAKVTAASSAEKNVKTQRNPY
jgi:hypothetical protein